MAGEQKQDRKWNRFQRINFDKKQALKRLRRAETVSVRHARKFVLKRWRNIRDVRRIVASWTVSVGCLIAATGFQLYWDQRSYQAVAGATGGTYAEAAIGPIDTLNPLFANSPAADIASQLMFSRLLTYDSTGNLNYDLARDVAISDDERTYTIEIREDVKWHDGRALTADDVVFTAELLADAVTRTQIRGWDGISTEKINDYTVSFSLRTPYAPFQSALTFPILPHHILGTVAHDEIREHGFSSSPVGSGPFVFRLLQDIESSDTRVVHLGANEQYYRGSPKLARFQVLAVADEDAVLSALKTNEVNGASEVSQGLISQLPEGRYSVQSQPVQSGVYALLNNDSDILSDRTVRRALQRATNTEEIRQKVGGGVSRLDLPYTELQIDGKAPEAPEYDPGAAAKLLDEAGWRLEGDVRKKGGQELRLSVVTTKNIEYERALEVMIGQWRQLGVRVDESVVAASDPMQNFVQSVLQPRSYDILLYQLTLGGDPDVFAYWHSSQAVARGLNLANYGNQVADDILSSARSGSESKLRDSKHISFARQWLRDAPAIGLYQPAVHSVVGQSVFNTSPDAVLVAPMYRYEDARYWTVGERALYKTP